MILIITSDDHNDYLLSQTNYIFDLFERTHIYDNMTFDTPLETSVWYSLTNNVPLSDPSLYRTIMGSLVCLIGIRPNIAHAVHVVIQFVTTPSAVH